MPSYSFLIGVLGYLYLPFVNEARLDLQTMPCSILDALDFQTIDERIFTFFYNQMSV